MLICVCYVLKAYVCRCADSCVVCAQACESQRLITDAFLRFSPSYLLEQGISLNPQQVEFTCLSNWGSYVSASRDYKHTTTLILHLFYWCWRYAPILQSSHLRSTVFIHGVIFLAHVRTLDTWWHPTDLIRVEPSLWELTERLTDAKRNMLTYLKELRL